MAGNNQAPNITPALASEVNFNGQVQKITASLESRTAAKTKLRDDWKAIVAGFRKYEYTQIPVVRQSPDAALRHVDNVEIYLPVTEADADMVALDKLYGDGVYYLYRIGSDQLQDFMDMVEKTVPGFTKLVKSATAFKKRGGPELDKEATKAARQELRDLIAVLTVDLDALEDTEDTLNDVDKYINTIEKIANISAVANGKK